MISILGNIDTIQKRKEIINILINPKPTKLVDLPLFSADGKTIVDFSAFLKGLNPKNIKTILNKLPTIYIGGVDKAPIGAIQDPAGTAIGAVDRITKLPLKPIRTGSGGASSSIYNAFPDLEHIPNFKEGESQFNSTKGLGKKILHTHAYDLRKQNKNPKYGDHASDIILLLQDSYANAILCFNKYKNNLDIKDRYILNLVPLSASIFASDFGKTYFGMDGFHMSPSYTFMGIIYAMNNILNNKGEIPNLNIYYFSPIVKQDADIVLNEIKQALLQLI